ncbi:Uncharacterised protein [uncultured archaeon]|nr:Uncharacterised protein [uncultured archaeon]
MEGEVRHAKNYEERNNGFYYRAVVGHETCRLGREAACGKSRECRADRIVNRHSRRYKQDDLYGIEEQINPPKDPGSSSRPRRDGILNRSHCFCPKELAACHVQLGKDGNDHENNSQAADQLLKRSPEEQSEICGSIEGSYPGLETQILVVHAAGNHPGKNCSDAIVCKGGIYYVITLGVGLGENSGPCGREARYGLKESIHEADAQKYEGQGTEEGCTEPAQCDGRKSLLAAHITFDPQPLQDNARGHAKQGGQGKGDYAAGFMIQSGHKSWHQEQQSHDLQHSADDVEDNPELHKTSFSLSPGFGINGDGAGAGSS